MASNAPPIPGANMATAQNPAPDPPRQVAVIAIHGVGRHALGASAEAIATLLASQDRADNAQAHLNLPKGSRRCSGFDIESIEVPLAAVATEPLPLAPAKTLWDKIFTVFDERRGFLDVQRRFAAQPRSKQRKQEPQPLSQQQAEHATLVEEAQGKDFAPKRLSPNPAPQDLLFDYQYMLSQLADYHAEPGRTFSTMRFVSRRFVPPNPAGPAIAPPTHIYDAHYSDLSKNQSSFVGFFYAFYQLLFHLAALGLKAVYWAEAENSTQGPAGWPWRLLSTLHALPVRILVMFIPLLNLSMLLIGASAFADKLIILPAAGAPAGSLPWANDLVLGIIGAVFAGLIGIGASLLLLRRMHPPKTPFIWSLLPLVGAAVSIGVFYLAALGVHWWGPTVSVWKCLALLGWLVVAGGAVFAVARRLATMQRGAKLVARILYPSNALVFLFLLGREWNPASQAATASVLIIQLIFGELVLFWTICLVAELLSWPLSEFCLAMTAEPAKKARARAAHRTGRFTFAISASFFLIVTLAIWSGICSYTGNKLHVFDRVTALSVSQNTFAKGDWDLVVPNTCRLVSRIEWLASHKKEGGSIRTHTGARSVSCDNERVLREPDLTKDPSALSPLAQYFNGLLLVSVTPGLPLTLALIAASFFLILWGVAPSVLYEIRPKRTPPSDEQATIAGGEWLSRGIDNVAVLIRALWFGIVPVPLFFGVLNFLSWEDYHWVPDHLLRVLDSLSRVTLPLIQGTGAVLAVSAAAIVALILKSGGAVLDTILDVDNYLRAMPQECTPRAQIAERITSLLRYVAAYRDPQGRPYERLIIVAHSLGTLVSADLLRFIARSRANDHDPVLHPDGLHAGDNAPAIPMYLMTMGSPLRPLLNRFFPHLYEWVTPVPDNSSRANRLRDALPAQPALIVSGALPEPAALCVKGWCNAYRSGDYVGRYLWNVGWLQRNQDVSQNGQPAQILLIQDASPSTRAEMCIGLGAHTHYWDRNAPDVAHVLSKLIHNPTEIFR